MEQQFNLTGSQQYCSNMNVLGLLDVPVYIFYPLVIVLLLYLHKKWQFSYWEKQGVPGPKPWPLIGSVATLLAKEPAHITDYKNWKKYGKSYGIYEPTNNALMIMDPEDIKTIFIKDFDKFSDRRAFAASDSITENFLFAVSGEKWHTIRSVITPTFSGAKLKRMSELLVECSEDLAEYLIKVSNNEKEFDPKRIFGAYTMDVIANTAFKTKINSLEDPDNIFVKNARQVFQPDINLRQFLIQFFPKIAGKLRLSFIDKTVLNFFSGVVKKIMNLRKDENQISNDFLSLLRESMVEKSKKEKSNSTNPSANGTENGQWKKEAKEVMTEDVVLAQCVLFFLAGYDTTATTISMAAYNLAVHPQCQDKLIEEIDESVKKHGSLTYDSLGEMPYLNAVVKESLRLYAPATRTEREAKENYQLGDIYLEKGTIVVAPIYCIHRDPDHWPEPEKFDPERFMGAQDDMNPYVYLPFGLGRRNCVAMRFALMEVKMALAVSLTKVKFLRAPKTKVPPELRGFGLLQPYNMVLGVEARQNK